MKTLTEIFEEITDRNDSKELYYCFTYDVKNSKDKSPEDFKEEIYQILSDAGAVDFESGIASTFLFKYPEINVSGLNAKIKDEMKNICYYYLMCVADNGGAQIINCGNDRLEQNFKDSQK